MTVAVLILAALWLAYRNGANGNFKGVAMLPGSGTVGYREALTWTIVTKVSLAAEAGLRSPCVRRCRLTED